MSVYDHVNSAALKLGLSHAARLLGCFGGLREQCVCNVGVTSALGDSRVECSKYKKRLPHSVSALVSQRDSKKLLKIHFL